MIFRTMALSVAVAVALAAGCDQSDPISAPCRDIPANGCPLLDDDSECTDRCCAAAYSCSDGTWTLEHACPQFQGCDAGTSTPVEDAGSYCDVAGFDAPPGAGGGEGCVALISPDCPLSEALVCSINPCLACEAFFVCTDGAWILWGECSAEGGVTLRN
jgi:hypothetical protein